jgi:hypothetical protein
MDPRGGMRDDNSGTGGQWDDPMSKSGQGQGQGQWDQGGGELFAFLTSRSGFRPQLRALSPASGSMVRAPANYILFRQHWWRRYIRPTACSSECFRNRRWRRPDWYYRIWWPRYPIGPVFGPVWWPGEVPDQPESDRWLCGPQQKCSWSGYRQAS